MSDEQGYNGWKNYETWAVALWIDNDQGSYSESRSIVQDIAVNHVPLYDEGPASEIADALKEWQEYQMPELEASVWSDLLNAAFSEVDWYEIAENYLSEMTNDD